MSAWIAPVAPDPRCSKHSLRDLPLRQILQEPVQRLQHQAQPAAARIDNLRRPHLTSMAKLVEARDRVDPHARHRLIQHQVRQQPDRPQNIGARDGELQRMAALLNKNVLKSRPVTKKRDRPCQITQAEP
jgi:hypothetical protein